MQKRKPESQLRADSPVFISEKSGGFYPFKDVKVLNFTFLRTIKQCHLAKNF